MDLLRQLVAERAELPVASVTSESRLLGDLHLNSISVGQLIAEAAKRLGLPPVIGLTDFATATVGRAAAALEEMARNRGQAVDESKRIPSGVDSWVRPFVCEWVETPLEARTTESARATSSWQLFAAESYPLKARLHEALRDIPGVGVVVCLPPQITGAEVSLLLASAKAAQENGSGKFILVQSGQRAGSLARTLHLESPQIQTCVVEFPNAHPQAVEWIVNEALALQGHRDVRYDESGRRYESVMKALPPTKQRRLPLGPDDILLVTGGGKGIAAECARHLARKSGARLVLMGRSRPEQDAELAANLVRFGAAGIRVRYLAADVTDATAVQSALATVQRELGAVTAFIHAAGRNVPQLLGSLDEAAFHRTLAPKVDGARNVLAALDANQLRLFVTFGSIIGRWDPLESTCRHASLSIL